MFKNCWTVRALSVLTCAHVVLLIGVICFGIWGIPAIIKIQIQKQTQLENGTDQWDRFEALPFPLKFTVRFFNVKNWEELQTHNDAKAILSESKPYVYRIIYLSCMQSHIAKECPVYIQCTSIRDFMWVTYTLLDAHWRLTISKKNITANDLEDSLTYNRSMTLTYEDSQLYNDSDIVSIVNPVLLAALQITNTIDRIALAGCMDKIFYNDMNKLFINKTVRELVVDGIVFGHENRSIGVACSLIRRKAYDLVKNIRPIEVIGEKPNRFMRFSMFIWKTDKYSKLQKPDGEYTVLRGRNEMTELGHIIRWNNSTEIDTWGNRMSVNNKTCRKVRGTDSTIFSPKLREGGSLDMLVPDVCRIVTIYYKGKSTYSGLEGYRYETLNTTFWSKTKNPENDCYCTRSTTNQFGEKDCYLDGVFDFKPCLGAPILVSFPHFKDAHDKYKENVTFSNDVTNATSDFQSYLLVEPNTGIPLQGRIRVQMSAVLRPEFLLEDLTPSNMTRGIIPILWLEESFDLPEKYVIMLNDQYFSKVALATGLKYGAVAVITAMLVISAFFLIRKKYIRPTKNTTIEKYQ